MIRKFVVQELESGQQVVLAQGGDGVLLTVSVDGDPLVKEQLIEVEADEIMPEREDPIFAVLAEQAKTADIEFDTISSEQAEAMQNSVDETQTESEQ